MTLYETIFQRRQVRKFEKEPLEQDTLDKIMDFISQADQLEGYPVSFELLSDREMTGATAPHYLVSYCEPCSSAYAGAGYILQMANLYIQSMKLGSGWFMNAKPKNNRTDFCIALALGNTKEPMRKDAKDFKRIPISKISLADNNIAQAVRLAPSSLNSQPWKVVYGAGRIILEDVGRGMARPILKNKLNKIDLGIAARHAALALEEEGNIVTKRLPNESGKNFQIELSYQ